MVALSERSRAGTEMGAGMRKFVSMYANGKLDLSHSGMLRISKG